MNDRDFTVKSTVYLLVYPAKALSKWTVVMFTDIILFLYTIVQGANETKCTGILAHKLDSLRKWPEKSLLTLERANGQIKRLSKYRNLVGSDQ